MSEDWLDQMLRDFQDKITRGTFEGVYDLPAPELGRVMEKQAESCVHAFVELFGISKDLSLEEFLEKMAYGGSSKVEISREGDSILWAEKHEGQCMCPLVKRGVVKLDPALCNCAVHWLRMLVERHVDRPVRVELLNSVAAGSKDCTFRIKLGS